MWIEDLRNYQFKNEYDVITSHGTLHFVSKNDWKNFIQFAKHKTKKNGIHIIQIFTNKIPASPDIAPYAIGLANEGELFEQYNDWKIIKTDSYVFKDKHPGVKKHYHASNKIIAMK